MSRRAVLNIQLPPSAKSRPFSLAALFKQNLKHRASKFPPIAGMAKAMDMNPENVTVGHVLVCATLIQAMQGRSPIIIELLNRIDGKIPDTLNANINNPFSHMSDTDFTAVANRVLRKGDVTDVESDDEQIADTGIVSETTEQDVQQEIALPESQPENPSGYNDEGCDRGVNAEKVAS